MQTGAVGEVCTAITEGLDVGQTVVLADLDGPPPDQRHRHPEHRRLRRPMRLRWLRWQAERIGPGLSPTAHLQELTLVEHNRRQTRGPERRDQP